MSGFEVAGLVSGIISLLPLAYDAINTIKNRCNDFRLNTRKLTAIEKNLNQISQHSQQLRRQYGGHRLHISHTNASLIENDFKDLESILQQVTERLTEISQYDQSRLSRKKLQQLFNGLTLIVTNKRTSICDEIINQLNIASDRLRHINHLLVTVNTTQSISNTQNDIVHQLQSMAIVDRNTSEPPDGYTPSFYVPSNPPIAKQCLDYATMDDRGNALTSEGKLKARLLHLINKRQENPDSLPIVAAVGMPGTGKTCALRGLNAENDLRQLFHDGILFLFCGPSASEDQIKQGLCSVVSQTGGNTLSREMNAIEGPNAIDIIIEKVSAWFRHKKCLFLVDDIWNKTATGSAFLSKLSTVVDNCDTISGLVYTTRDERIDTFDTPVRFEWLAPHSSACCNILASAAGFSPEQIDQVDQRDAFHNILTHCKGLKMALVVAGRNVRTLAARYREHKAIAWDSYAKALDDFPRHLLSQEYGEYGSLISQFSVSLQTLTSRESDKLSFHMPYRIEQVFESLCIAEKGHFLHDSMLRRLWGLESVQQAREVSKLFADVSLVETTCEFIDGSYSEGILVHDLLHDYANSLADQHYVDRSWIKGWEVWGLRLLESYCGVDENVVSNSQTFERWWRKEEVSRHYNAQYHLRDVISRIALHSRLQSGQTLLEHSSGIERFFNVSGTEPITFVEVCFTLQKSTVVEMHGFVTTMAHEREVALSSLTSRSLIFAALLFLRIERLLESNHGASSIAQEDEIRQSLHNNEETVQLFQHRDSGSPPEPQKTSLDNETVLYAYVLPINLGEYLQTSIVLNWALYDECVKAPAIDDDESYRLLGIPLSLEKLNQAGIEICVLWFVFPCPFFHCKCPSFRNSPVHSREEGDGVVFEFETQNDNYQFITTAVFGPYVSEESSPVAHSSSRYLHMHDLGNPKYLHTLKRHTIPEILELWSGNRSRSLREEVKILQEMEEFQEES